MMRHFDVTREGHPRLHDDPDCVGAGTRKPLALARPRPVRAVIEHSAPDGSFIREVIYTTDRATPEPVSR